MLSSLAFCFSAVLGQAPDQTSDLQAIEALLSPDNGVTVVNRVTIDSRLRPIVQGESETTLKGWHVQAITARAVQQTGAAKKAVSLFISQGHDEKTQLTLGREALFLPAEAAKVGAAIETAFRAADAAKPGTVEVRAKFENSRYVLWGKSGLFGMAIFNGEEAEATGLNLDADDFRLIGKALLRASQAFKPAKGS